MGKMTYTYKQIAKATIGAKKYQVVEVNGQYYQIQRNRVKIGKNEEKSKHAIRVMLKEAEYDLLDIFDND